MTLYFQDNSALINKLLIFSYLYILNKYDIIQELFIRKGVQRVARAPAS